MTTNQLWNPPPVYSPPVRGKAERPPINRILLVGRNYQFEMELVVAIGSGRGRQKASKRSRRAAKPKVRKPSTAGENH